MTTTFACPACGATYHMAEESIGRKGRCKQCGHVFRLEASVAEAVPPPITGERAAGETDGQQAPKDTATPRPRPSQRATARRALGVSRFAGSWDWEHSARCTWPTIPR